MTTAQAATKTYNRATVRGRVEAVRKYDKNRFTRLISPSVDPYSPPQVFEVRSKAQLGSVGEEITIDVLLGGYRRKPFRVTDKETGELTTVTPVEMVLDAIEA